MQKQTMKTELAELINRAGNSIEFYRCDCGNESNLLWVYGKQKNRILACSKECAVLKVTAQIKIGFMVADAHAQAIDTALSRLF